MKNYLTFRFSKMDYIGWDCLGWSGNVPPVLHLIRELYDRGKFIKLLTAYSMIYDEVLVICAVAPETTIDELDAVFNLYPIQNVEFSQTPPRLSSYKPRS